jgi:hypothetical protein
MYEFIVCHFNIKPVTNMTNSRDFAMWSSVKRCKIRYWCSTKKFSLITKLMTRDSQNYCNGFHQRIARQRRDNTF